MKLNTEQSRVVNTFDRNILLTAPAGTGKTSTLAMRVKQIIALRKARADEILCLTYTNRACNEMISRIRVFLTNSELQGLIVKTMHGFSLTVVNEHPECIGLAKQQYVAASEAIRLHIFTQVLLNNLLWDMSMGPFDNCVKVFGQYFALMIEERANTRSFEQAHQRLQDPKNEAAKRVLDVRVCRSEMYLDFLQSQGVSLVKQALQMFITEGSLTYEMMSTFAHLILSSVQGMQYYFNRYKFIMIDEVQDISIGMYNTLTYLFGTANVMLCGDGLQTIYAWRGSNPSYIISEFKKRHYPIEISLVLNYRSVMPLQMLGVDLSDKLLLNKSFRAKALLDEFRDTGKYTGFDGEVYTSFEPTVKLVESSTALAEFKYIQSEIHRIRETEPDASFAVLARTNKRIQSLTKLSERLKLSSGSDDGIQFGSSVDFNTIKTPLFDVMRDCMEHLTGAYQDSRVVNLLRKLQVLSESDLKEILSWKESMPAFSLTDYCDPYWDMKEEPFEFLINPSPDDYFIIFDTETTGADVSFDDVIQIGAIKLDSKFQIVERFNRLLKTNKDLGTSVAVHHITYAVLDQLGEDRNQVISEFLDFVGDQSYIVGHNVEFDLHIMKKEIARATDRSLKYKRVIDTCDLARRLIPGNSFTLESLGQRLRFNSLSSHDALDDVLATRELLIILREKYLMPLRGKVWPYYQKYAINLRVFATTMRRFKRAVETDSCEELCEKMYQYFLPLTGVTYSDEITMDSVVSGNAELSRAKVMFDSIIAGVVSKCREYKDFYTGTQLKCLLKPLSVSKSEMDSVLKLANKIPIMTVHASKGCEFDYVFFTEVTENVFNVSQGFRFDDSFKRDEPKRLFYVASTRPRKGLWYMAITTGGVDISPFVARIDKRLIQREDNPFDEGLV